MGKTTTFNGNAEEVINVIYANRNEDCYLKFNSYENAITLTGEMPSHHILDKPNLPFLAGLIAAINICNY